MMSTTIGFLGGGRIARILISALVEHGVDPGSIAVSESSEAARSILLGELPGLRAASQAEIAACAEVIFLALPPAAIGEAIGGGRLIPLPGSVVVSLAPKVNLRDISSLLGGFDRLARMIPNAPSIVGAGYNPICFGPALGGADRSALRALFSAFGKCPEVEESKLEGYAVLTAMGPTYFSFQVYELMRIASGFGLDSVEVATATRAMLEGAVATIFDSGLAPERVLDLIPSKPIAADEAAIKAIYEAALTGAFAKLRS
jgi:pyrroline-5-carboxylate reductase